MASCYRTNDLLGAHAVCQQQQQQFQHQQQQQHHHSLNVAQQQQQQAPQKDYSIPLFVDCSVEYELPKQAKPPVGVRVEPLLMIHPCHFRKMEIQTRSPFVNNMPNFKQRNSIKTSLESNKNVTATSLPVGTAFHQSQQQQQQPQQQHVGGAVKALDTQIQHHQKLHKPAGHMPSQQQSQCSVAAGGYVQQHYQQELHPPQQQQRIQKPHKTVQTNKDYALQSAYCDFSNRLNSHNQMLQLQTQEQQQQQQQQQQSSASYAPSWNGYMGQAAEMPTPRKPMLPTDNYIIKKSNNTQCYSTSQVNSAAAQLKAVQGQVMYQQQQQQQQPQQPSGMGKKDAMLSNGCDMYKNNLTNTTTTTTSNNNLINNNNNNSTNQCNRNYNNNNNNNNNNNMPNKQYADTSGGLWEQASSATNANNTMPSSMAAIPQQQQQQQQNFQIPGDINMSSQALIKNYQINRNIINSAKYRQYLKSHRIHPYMMTGSCINNTGFPQMTSVFPHHQMQQVPCYNV